MKHTLHKTLAVLPLATACAVFGTSVQAEKITFNGAVQDTTCTPSVNGGGADGTVNLDVIKSSNLPNLNDTFGAKSFDIGLSACSRSDITAKAYFYSSEAGRVTNDKLNLITPASTGSGWQYELLAANDTPLKVGTAATPVNDINDTGASIAAGTATLTYKVRYFRSADLQEGTGQSEVNYVVHYF